MPLVAAYHRPDTLDEALSLLAESNRIPLAGGTVVNADRARPLVEVVDLQALGLAGVDDAGGRLRIGAMTTLDALADDPVTPDLVARTARAELPSTLRTLATVGGTVAEGDADSTLLAALLVHDAEAHLAGAEDVPLAVVLAVGVPPGALVTGVSIDASGQGSLAVTGRTPADTPIVAAVGRRAADGIHLALTGVAGRPVLVDAAQPTADLSPDGDFRGSSVYRLELARVLAARVVEELG
ncbi:MAG: FAD binding domain-containing protein [Ilumatobacter sp.]|uniref:FAD binding domain-containing protein n=1 Tax=Ilumatobacter sp. TaxID=1967498 RepID=UPI0026057E9E|nr:FAD binding domain-containing protein [Ilumatobacter sp.]MDJ0767279.1 FAD binding domain-containing protein [Ilumatobacter sp.]